MNKIEIIKSVLIEENNCKEIVVRQPSICYFGSINVETGVEHDGYVEGGEMKYKVNVQSTIANWLRKKLLK